MTIIPKIDDVIIFEYINGKVAVSFGDFRAFLQINGKEPTEDQLDNAIDGRIDAWIVRGAYNDNKRRTGAVH